MCSYRFEFQFSCLSSGLGRNQSALHSLHVSQAREREREFLLIHLSCSGLVLQDLTFVHVGNQDYMSKGVINFSKRWQQYNIIVNMKRFKKW